MSEGYIVPVPAPTTCRCNANDGMCHGWEGEAWFPVSWSWPTAATMTVRFAFSGGGALPLLARIRGEA